MRRGTADEQATEEDLSKLLERRITHSFPVTGQPLDLEEHLNQLNIFSQNIEPEIFRVEDMPFVQALKVMTKVTNGMTGRYKTEKSFISGGIL